MTLYDVTQTRYYVIDGFRIKDDAEVVTVNEFKSIGFRMRQISSGNIAR